MNTQYFMVNNHRTWAALRKAWRGYVIAKNKYEYDNMKYYISLIQNIQNELGLKVSLFSDVELSDNSGGSFANNNIVITQEQDEQERLRDYSYEDKYFEDDFNKADRFTS